MKGNPIYRCWWLYYLWVIVLVGCGTGQQPDVATAVPTSDLPTLVPVDLPISNWGDVELIAQAEQSAAPVFRYTAADRMITWVGAYAGQAYHFTEGITDVQHRLDLPTFFPYDQTLLSTSQGALKLWLDRNNSEFNLRIQASTIGFDGTVETGIIPVNNQRTRNYSVIPISQREFRIVWSGGLGEVTNLYLHQIDDSGRPTGGDLLQIDGDHPALIQDSDGAIHLFWLSNNGRDAYHATFDEIGAPTLVNVRRITSNNLSLTDAITDFSVGFDATTAYLLWNVRRIDDSQFILMSSGQLTDEQFSLPAPLLTPEGASIQWAKSASGIHNPLPVVVNSEDDLLVVWFANGELQSTELVTRSGRLIGLPHIDATATRIGVSWSQVTADGFSNLLYVEQSRLP
ncbi:MAG: hypothetical protein WBC91_00345 [Phototrophicaceae bacterium]